MATVPALDPIDGMHVDVKCSTQRASKGESCAVHPNKSNIEERMVSTRHKLALIAVTQKYNHMSSQEYGNTVDAMSNKCLYATDFSANHANHKPSTADQLRKLCFRR